MNSLQQNLSFASVTGLHPGMVSFSVFAFKTLNKFESPVLQVALLRQKLASEQQRARTAEASLAAQHLMQELLQTAVQAVLRTSGQQQVNHQEFTLSQ
jgi:hypothetical protein